jgi:hypothetical protein
VPDEQPLTQHVPALQAPFVHGEVDDSYTQFSGSLVQLARVVELVQVLPTALQTGSALHVQAAVPAVPVQLWCIPQTEGVP